MEQLFVPQKPPEDQEQINEYLWRMFQDIAQTVESIADGRIIEERNVVPTKPRNGMLVYSDGTDWNPGSGEGFYGYEAGAWVKL